MRWLVSIIAPSGIGFVLRTAFGRRVNGECNSDSAGDTTNQREQLCWHESNPSVEWDKNERGNARAFAARRCYEPPTGALDRRRELWGSHPDARPSMTTLMTRPELTVNGGLNCELKAEGRRQKAEKRRRTLIRRVRRTMAVIDPRMASTGWKTDSLPQATDMEISATAYLFPFCLLPSTFCLSSKLTKRAISL
jgi:hypothetical protein